MRRLAAVLLLGVLVALRPGMPGFLPLEAQEASEPPAAVADEYLRGIEALAWRATAQRIHPEALNRLRETLRILTEPDDSGGRLLDALTGDRSAEEYFALDGGSLFVSVMRALERESPGIINAMTERDTEVVGTVADGDTLRHVVYRLRWRLSGAEDEIELLTLAPDARDRWRVLRAPELESLRPALRGLGLPGPPNDARGVDPPAIR